MPRATRASNKDKHPELPSGGPKLSQAKKGGRKTKAPSVTPIILSQTLTDLDEGVKEEEIARIDWDNSQLQLLRTLSEEEREEMAQISTSAAKSVRKLTVYPPRIITPAVATQPMAINEDEEEDKIDNGVRIAYQVQWRYMYNKGVVKGQFVNCIAGDISKRFDFEKWYMTGKLYMERYTRFKKESYNEPRGIAKICSTSLGNTKVFSDYLTVISNEEWLDLEKNLRFNYKNNKNRKGWQVTLELCDTVIADEVDMEKEGKRMPARSRGSQSTDVPTPRSSSLSKVTKLTKKGKSTITTRMLAKEPVKEELNKAVKLHISDLIQIHTCSASHTRLLRFTCFYVNGEHLAIFP
jgi:hypothetical protein